MGIEAEFQALGKRDGAAALRMVHDRSGAGDPAAIHLLGLLRLWGADGGPTDPSHGYGLVLEAAKRGHVPATQTLSALLATGTGVGRDPDRAQALVAASADRSPAAAEQLRVRATAPAAVPPRQVLRDDPLVARVDGLLSRAECAYLIALAKPKVAPSTVLDPSGRRIANPVRDSHGANFPVNEEDVVVHAINCRIAEATGTRWDQGEPLHILRYRKGQQFRPHLDALPGVSNQRVITCLVYLNDAYAGGETAFGDELRVRGGTGDAIVFATATPDGRPDPRAEHAGLPVTRGVKWLASRWIRQRRYHPLEPDTIR